MSMVEKLLPGGVRISTLGTVPASEVSEREGGAANVSDETCDSPSFGASFTDLGALTIDDAIAKVSAFGSAQIGRSGNHATVSFDDGLHESADVRVARALAALGLPTTPPIPGLLTAKRPSMFKVGNATLTIETRATRTPTLLELARKAARKEDILLNVAQELRQNFQGMIRKRGLEVHCRDFGSDFVDLLSKSTGSTRLLVLGAGEARFEKELLTGSFERGPRSDAPRQLASRPDADKPQIVSVDLGQAPADLVHPKHKFLSGFFSQVQGVGEGGEFDALVDMIGCFTYTPTLSEDLQRGVDLLREGGRMFIGTTDSVAVYKDDRLYLLPEFLASIPGLEVNYQRPDGLTDGTYLFFSVRKTRPDVEIPSLDMIFEQSSYPRACSKVHIFAPSGAPLIT